MSVAVDVRDTEAEAEGATVRAVDAFDNTLNPVLVPNPPVQVHIPGPFTYQYAG